MNTIFYSNEFIYYASGIWLGDIAMQGAGEAGLLIGLLVGFVACIIMPMLYFYVVCKLVGRFSNP